MILGELQQTSGLRQRFGAARVEKGGAPIWLLLLVYDGEERGDAEVSERQDDDGCVRVPVRRNGCRAVSQLADARASADGAPSVHLPGERPEDDSAMPDLPRKGDYDSAWKARRTEHRRHRQGEPSQSSRLSKQSCELEIVDVGGESNPFFERE